MWGYCILYIIFLCITVFLYLVHTIVGCYWFPYRFGSRFHTKQLSECNVIKDIKLS